MPFQKGAYQPPLETEVDRLKPIEPVEPLIVLTTEERDLFDHIVNSRESTSWSRSDRLIAGQLARTMRHLEKVQEQMATEEYVIFNAHGTMMQNPLLGAMMKLSNSVTVLQRALGLAATMRGINGAEQEKRARAEQAAKEKLKELSESDDLI
jgi:hypothetical protein